jgi:hypothetical protein
MIEALVEGVSVKYIGNVRPIYQSNVLFCPQMLMICLYLQINKIKFRFFLCPVLMGDQTFNPI